eukprot:4316609-Pleurochrysis_carterae.AAC.1
MITLLRPSPILHLGVRPIGCRVYPKLMLRPHKLAPQWAPCIYLGKARDQPGHMCFDPTAKRIYISPYARFIETEFSGLAAATRAQTHKPAQTHQP